MPKTHQPYAVGPCGALVLGDVDAVGVHEDEPPHIRAQTPRALHGARKRSLFRERLRAVAASGPNWQWFGPVQCLASAQAPPHVRSPESFSDTASPAVSTGRRKAPRRSPSCERAPRGCCKPAGYRRPPCHRARPTPACPDNRQRTWRDTDGSLGGHDDAVRPEHVPCPPHRLVGGVARMVYVHVLARHAQLHAVRLHASDSL